MSTGRDDDALHWDGDDDPTLDVGSMPEEDPLRGVADTSEPLALPDGFSAVGKGSEKVGRVASDGTVTMPGGAQPMSNGTLVALGILAGAYLLFTIGWIIGGIRLQGTARFLVSPVGYQVAFWLAVTAPALWFLTTHLLTRASKSWVRIVWLIAGIVVLIPWPFVMVGAVGQ